MPETSRAGALQMSRYTHSFIPSSSLHELESVFIIILSIIITITIVVIIIVTYIY